MRRRITKDEFINRLYNINKNIFLIGDYHTTKTNTKFGCYVCNHIWVAKPSRLINNKPTGCPKCNNSMIITEDEFNKRLSKINKNIRILEYIGYSKRSTFKCNICDHIWKTKPSKIICDNTGCPKCHNCVMLNISQIKERVNKINNTITIISTASNGIRSKINVYCNICKNTWSAIPNNLFKGKGCPNCNISHGERIIQNILIKADIKFKYNHRFDDCRNKNSLPFDFYLPEIKTCVITS